jgi:hypothetical protein
VRALGRRRGAALRGSLPPDAAPSVRGPVELLAAGAESSGEALARAWHELVLLGACAGTRPGLWFAAMRWVRARRELAYWLWRTHRRAAVRRPSEGELRRDGETIRAALVRAAVPAAATVVGLAALVAGAHVAGVSPAFIAGLLGDFGRWWSHLSLGEQVLSVLGVAAILGLMGMDLLPAIGLAAGASTFADLSPLISSFIRAPGRTTREVLRNLTPAQVVALGAGFLAQRLLPAAGGRLLGAQLREEISGAAARGEGELGKEVAPAAGGAGAPAAEGVGATAAEGAGGPTVEEILTPGGRLIGRAGSSSAIRIVHGGPAEAEKLFQELARGGTDVTPPGHVGRLVKLPDNGGYIGYRPFSRSGPPTIDVNVPGSPIREIKFTP